MEWLRLNLIETMKYFVKSWKNRFLIAYIQTKWRKSGVHMTCITIFSIQTLTKTKIGLPNFDFHQFFSSKWLKHSKKYVKMYLYIEFEKNRSSHFWNIHFRSPFQFSLLHFRFFYFRQNLEILFTGFSVTVYKIWYFYLY